MIGEEDGREIDGLLDRVMQELDGEVLDISPNRVGLI
jgi:hypothetical protein